MIRLAWPFVALRFKSIERLVPVVLAAAVKLMFAVPLLPDIWLTCTHLLPAVSILQEELQVNVRGTVPPSAGMVSVIFETESWSGASAFLHAVIFSNRIKVAAIQNMNLFFILSFLHF